MSDSGPTVALFGGAFDPPHVAHVLAAVWALATEELTAVWIEPVFVHPLDKQLAPFEQRIAMCEAAFAWLGAKVQIRRDEAQLGGSGRTIDLLEYLSERHPELNFRLILGTDQLTYRARWKDFDRVLALAPPIVLGRPGHPDAPGFEARITLPEISSTAVRAALCGGQQPQGLVPRAVLAYIAQHGLYGGRS